MPTENLYKSLIRSNLEYFSSVWLSQYDKYNVIKKSIIIKKNIIKKMFRDYNYSLHIYSIDCLHLSLPVCRLTKYYLLLMVKITYSLWIAKMKTLS